MGMATATESLRSDARQLQGDLARLRRAIHQEPEIGLHLPRTQERVLGWLDGLGYEVTVGDGLDSVTAVLRGTAGVESGSARSVLLRADMDALPVQEKSGVDFTSTIDGVMHACGHDLHTSMLAGAASLLSVHREQIVGDVVLMFQPGEEGYNGAGLMIDAGVLEASGRRVEAAFGMHVMSAVGPSHDFMTRTGPVLSAVDGLYVTVLGQGGHGASPHAAADPVTVAAEMLTALQTMVTRQFSVFDPVIITAGRFSAGTQRNIIPETAGFDATIRSFSSAAQAQLQIAIPRLLRGIAHAHGVEVEVDYRFEYPPTINHGEATRLVEKTVSELFDGARHTKLANPLTASEDFSRVLNQVPGSFVLLSARDPEDRREYIPDNHSAYVKFDDSILADGAALYAQLAINQLAKPSLDLPDNRKSS